MATSFREVFRSTSSSPSFCEWGVDGQHHISRHSAAPDYSSSIVREALQDLASIDPIELCHEAKVEHCRATRDLSSCGRYVQHVLASCRHASLCAECSQRCDICPICRASIPNNGCKIQLRLYNKCIEAGLIPKKYEERSVENEHNRKYILADVQRLYSLFDVALENNLVSLVCHYVTDVCMDESAVSSDAVLAFLLDEVVVKDWCQQKFKDIISHLLEIYAPGVEGMDARLSATKKCGLHLTGLSNVMDVLESSSNLHDLHQLSANILKTKQHLEVMTWCIRHKYLEHVPSRHPDYHSWSTQVHERKTAAVKRAWPDYAGNSAEKSGSTLFIEDALSNLAVGQEDEGEMGELDILCLQENTNGLYPYPVDSMSGTYPFKNLRAAADILFLQGTPDMVVAKQATFLYYLFDRHWTMPDLEWRHIVDDFAASFGISRHSVLECLSFYLLDDHTEQALQEVEHLLPGIAGPETHAKVAQVLLQRQRPDIALMVLRCSGHDGFSGYVNSKYENVQLVSLGEAVMAVRVRVEFGLLTAAFMYQRMHCTKVKEDKIKCEPHIVASNISRSRDHSWIYHVEVLVTELCSLCVRRNLVDRMIELPWNSNEEKFLCKCLYEKACQDPSAICGSLLVVFYLQRYRYIEAYQFDRKLRELESDFPQMDEAGSRIQLIRQWRIGLVDKSIELVPEVQRQQAKTRKFDEVGLFSSGDTEMHSENAFSNGTSSGSILRPYSSKESSVLLHSNANPLLPKEISFNKNGNLNHPIRASTPEFSSLVAPSGFRGTVPDSHQSPPTMCQTNSAAQANLPTNSCNGRTTLAVRANGVMTREMVLRNDGGRELSCNKPTPFRKEVPSSIPMSIDDSNTDSTLSIGKRDSSASSFKARGGLRWRSDESSDDEAEMDLETILVHEGSYLSSKNRYNRI